MNIQDKLNELRKIVGRKTSAENNANADLSKVRQEDKTESDASNNVINPIEIVEINDIEQLRFKYICEISDHVCSGELWKAKLKKYINLLALPNHLGTEEINNRIDSIWKARNDIAHANTRGLILNYDGNTYKYDSNIGAEEYTQFALVFSELGDDVIAFLSKIDKLTLEKWEATDATLLKSDM